MSNNTNKSAAMKLIQAYRHLLAASSMPREINASDIIRIASDTINSADLRLFDDGDLTAAVVGELLKNYRLELHGESGFRAIQDFASIIVRDIFRDVENRNQAAFAVGSRRRDLLVSALTAVDASKPVTVSQIATRADMSRESVKKAVADGRIPAEKIGNTYIINADDAAVFIASRRTPEN